MDFPILFDHCPWCGYRERIADEIKNELVPLGKMGPESIAFTRQDVSPVFDIKYHDKSILHPMLIRSFDICKSCGREYIFRIDRIEGELRIQGIGAQRMVGGGGTQFGRPMPRGGS